MKWLYIYIFSEFRLIYLAEFTNNKIPNLPYCDYAYNLTVINTYADQLNIFLKKTPLNFSNVSFSAKFIQSYKRDLTMNGGFSLSVFLSFHFLCVLERTEIFQKILKSPLEGGTGITYLEWSPKIWLPLHL